MLSRGGPSLGGGEHGGERWAETAVGQVSQGVAGAVVQWTDGGVCSGRGG